MPTTPPPQQGPTRRGLLALGAVSLAALAGCSSPLDTGGAESTTGASGPSGAPSVSPDVALATLALADLRAARDAVTATTQTYPGLAAALAPVAAMHQAHDDALADAVPDGSEPAAGAAPYAVPAPRAAALAGLRQREVELQARLADLAVQARSGAFAGLLAAMSAGTAQRVATWPT